MSSPAFDREFIATRFLIPSTRLRRVARGPAMSITMGTQSFVTFVAFVIFVVSP